MTEVKILIEGYAKKETEEVWHASSTTTLVKENGINILVDPGCNRKLLLEKLAEEGLKTGDIHFVVNTHMHYDHCVLSGMFENAKFLDGDTVYDQDKTDAHGGVVPGTDLKIISTPGHALSSCTLLIKNEQGETIAICADVFWWADNEEQKTDEISLIQKEDSFTANKNDLIESRKKVLEIADYIIPGHGKMFKVRK